MTSSDVSPVSISSRPDAVPEGAKPRQGANRFDELFNRLALSKNALSTPALLLFLSFLVVMPQAHAASVKAMWLAAGPKTYHSSPTAACLADKNYYVATAPFYGSFPSTKPYWQWYCQWCVRHHSNECPIGTLPASVLGFCINEDGTPNYSYKVVSPGVCRDIYSHAKNTCKADNDAQPNPTMANPVVVASGAKIERAIDFATADGLLRIARTYRSEHGRSSREGVSYEGLGVTWRFNFAWDLKLEPYFTSNRRFTVVKPNGAGFDFDFSTTGIATKTADSPSGLNVTLVSPTTFDATDIVNNGATFKVTDEESNEITLELYKVGTAKYSRARVKEIKRPSGYKWTFAYVTANELSSITDSFNRQFTFTWVKFAYPGEASASARAVSSIVLPDGTSLNYSYSGADASVAVGYEFERLEKVELKDASATVIDSTLYHYENTDFPYALTGITDHKNIRFATFTYDGNGRVSVSEHDGGADKHTFTYEKVGAEYHHKVTNALGKVTKFVFEKKYIYRNVLRLKRIDGEASANCVADQKSFTYPSALSLRVATSTDEEGRVTTYVRDTEGRPTKITRATGLPEEHVTDYTWSTTHNKPTQIVEPRLTQDLAYNTSGALTQLTQTDTTAHTVPYSTNGQTRVWAFAYTTEGLLDTVDGPLAGTGDLVDYDYDADGYLDKVTNELGHITDIVTVNGRGQPTKIRDENGIDTDMAYDARGRLTTVTVDPGPNQAVTAFVYDAIGQITKITRPNGAVLDYVYDDARRLMSVATGDGEKIEYTHDAMGGVTKREIKKADTTITFTQSQTFDEMGRLLSRIGATSQTTTFGYDKASNLTTVTDPRSNAYGFAYDGLNRLIKETDQSNEEVDLALDAQGNVATYEDPRNLQTTYVHNGFGEVIRRVSPDTGTTDYVRNTRGLVTQMTDARGVVTDYTYDDAGRLLTRSFPAATAENVTYTYDSIAGGNKGVGRLTSVTDESGSTAFTFDVRGNVVAEKRTVATQVHDVGYAYDSADNLTQVTYPSGRIVIYARDAQGRVTSVSTRKDTAAPLVDLTTNIVYQPMSGLIQALDYGNGLSILNAYNQDHDLSVLRVRDGLTDVISRSYSRTDNLNLTGITDNVTAGNSQSFVYTTNNRLQDAGGPWGDLTFLYDGVGNRTSRALTVGGVTTTQTYAYPATSNKPDDVKEGASTVRTFTHDVRGNLTGDTPYLYTYNNANRLKTVSAGATLEASYVYNAFEQLVSRTLVNATPSGAIHMIHNRAGRVIAETDGVGNTVREYIWLGALPLAVIADVDTVSPKLYYVHVDHLNRPIRMTDAAKATVWEATWLPHGGVHAITGTASLDARFPGQWFQLESGLHYNWHRHYDPTTGRYTQADPLGFVDGPSVYAYAVNSPQMYVDEDGRFVLPPGGIGTLLNLPRISPPIPLPKSFPPPVAGPGDVIPFPNMPDSGDNVPRGPSNDDENCGDDGCKKEQQRLQGNRDTLQNWINNQYSSGRIFREGVSQSIKRAVNDMNRDIAYHNNRCPSHNVNPAIAGQSS